MTKAFIREIFLSIQGEGTHIGEQQLFVRFCGCNLSCNYCDTDFLVSKSVEYTPDELLEKVNSFGKNLIISLTGGEPLVSVAFLKEFLPLARNAGHRIYLETNGTMYENLAEIIDLVDIVSADIKLESATGQRIPPDVLDKFFEIAVKKETFAKIVFDKHIQESEILTSIELAQKYDIELILQPKMVGETFGVSREDIEAIFGKFRIRYPEVRLIPQVHKFLNVR